MSSSYPSYFIYSFHNIPPLNSLSSHSHSITGKGSSYLPISITLFLSNFYLPLSLSLLAWLDWRCIGELQYELMYYVGVLVRHYEFGTTDGDLKGREEDAGMKGGGRGRRRVTQASSPTTRYLFTADTWNRTPKHLPSTCTPYLPSFSPFHPSLPPTTTTTTITNCISCTYVTLQWDGLQNKCIYLVHNIEKERWVSIRVFFNDDIASWCGLEEEKS